MSSIPPIGPSRVPDSDRESNGSNSSTLQKISDIFEKVRSFFQTSHLGTRSSEAQDPGFEKVQIKQSSAFITGWTCKKVENQQLKWTQKKSLEEIEELNEKQFPSIQPTSKIIEAYKVSFFTPYISRVLKSIGFQFDEARSDIFYSPTKERLELYIKDLKTKNPALSGLRLYDADLILPPDQFLELMLDDVLICGNGPENVHDLYFHIAPMLTNITRDPENYLRFKQDQKKLINGYLEQLQKAEEYEKKFLEDLNCALIKAGGSEIDMDQWTRTKQIIKYSLGAYLDIYSSLYFEDKFPPTEELTDDFLKILNSIIIRQPKWIKAWAKELHLTESEQDQVSQDGNTSLIIQYLYEKAKLDKE